MKYTIREIILHILVLSIVTPIVTLAVLNIQYIIIALVSVIGTFMIAEVAKRHIDIL